MKVVDSGVMRAGANPVLMVDIIVFDLFTPVRKRPSHGTVEGPNYCIVTFEISPGEHRPRSR
jgi:hypothetical protein